MNKDKINTKEVNEVVSISKKILNILYIVMIVGIIFLVTLLAKEWGILTFLLTLLKVATPFFIGFVIAWLFNPLVIKLQDQGLKRGLAAVLVYLGFLIILFVFFWFLIPTIYTQLNDLISSFPSIISTVKTWITDGFGRIGNISGLDLNSMQENMFNGVETLISGVTTNLPELILNSVGKIFSGIGTVLISLVIGIYMLLDFDSITTHLLNVIPDDTKKETE